MKKNTILTGILLITIGGLLISCSGTLRKASTRNVPVFFPSPPDTARIQFLMRFSNSQDIQGKRNFFTNYVLGDEPARPIIKPHGISVHNGKIYICDTMLPGLEIIDLKNKKFDYFVPGGLGELKKPLNCAFDDKGRLYISDVLRKQVVIFNADGDYLYAIGDGKSGKPTDVHIYNGKIWICDLQAHQIKVYNEHTRKFLFAFPEVKKATPQYLFSPTNLTIHDEKIYVTDTGDARIKVFNEQGEFIKRIGGFGKSPGLFVRPKGVAADHTGKLYVVDAAFENVQIFDHKGRILMYFGGPYKHPGNMWLPAGIEINYKLTEYFKPYVYPGFELKYIILVSNQYGPDRISIYGFIEPKK